MRTSVLVNNFNNARFLRMCIDSVLGQTRTPDEIIVYDDGSTDDSIRILETYGEAIRVIRGERQAGLPWNNQAKAIEHAFRACSGDIVFLLDSDDAFASGKIAAYLPVFAADESVVMVQSPLWKIDDDGVYTGIEYDVRRHASDYLRHIAETHEVNIYYPTSSLAFRRSYLQQRLPLEVGDGLALWPDARLSLIAPHFGKIVTLDQPFTWWRRHAASHTVVRKTSVYEQVSMNRSFYNAFCRARGLPQVSTWRSREHRRRWLRHISPEWLVRVYHYQRWWRGYHLGHPVIAAPQPAPARDESRASAA